MSILRIQSVALLVAFVVGIVGCATALQPGAESVRVLSESDKASCQKLQTFTTSDVGLKYASDAVTEGAYNRARNKVHEMGGNAVRILSITPEQEKDALKVFITADALKCS